MDLKVTQVNKNDKFYVRCNMPLEVPAAFSSSAGASTMGRPN